MNIVLLPMLIPFIGAIICLYIRRFPRGRHRNINRIVSGIASIALPFACLYILYRVRQEGVLVLRLGDWPDTLGVVFAIDLFGAIMLCLAGITQAITWWFLAAGGASRHHETHLIYPVFLLLGASVCWAFSTGDLFNLFVSFEIILLSSYVLLVYGNERSQIREAIKYVVLNIIASALFLAAAGFAYGMFGTLNMADLAVRIARAGYPPEATILGTILMIVFGTKAALFPLFFWLPDSYPKAPPGISAYFSGILTKVGVYCLYRVMTLIFRGPEAMEGWFQPILLAVAGFTMLVGVLSALSQWTMRRILSFHIISQIGYMIFGLGIFTPLGLAFGIFYIVHHIIVKASLFFVADTVMLNDGTEALKKSGGALKAYPVLAIGFLFAALSLAGLPPLSGFYGKYGLVVEGLVREHYVYVIISLITSLLTLASMAKIWRYVFWRERPENAPTRASMPGLIRATLGLVSVSILVAVFSGFVMEIALEAGNQLYSRDGYIQAVMGKEGLEQIPGRFDKEVALP